MSEVTYTGLEGDRSPEADTGLAMDGSSPSSSCVAGSFVGDSQASQDGPDRATPGSSARPGPTGPLAQPLTAQPPPETAEAIIGRIERLQDVPMVVSVELGRATMLVKDLLALKVGSLVELDRQVGSPVDLFVNGTLLARGEVVVIDDEFGVRLSEIVGGGRS
ncbi:MAG: flagellar motor switch protein FliN [Actinobacteria bacterium]|nr:flagellar motor switch protein FliN [Actinomycetota bacterium]